MRRRPFMPPIEPRRMGLEPALHLYCEKRKVDFGGLYRDHGVRDQAGRPIYTATAKLTFGRKHTFWQVQTWTTRAFVEDRLYNNLTRALDRKLRALGWLKNKNTNLE